VTEGQPTADAAVIQVRAEEDALDALRFGWGDAYEIGHDEERGYWARRRDGLGGEMTAAGPDRLWEEIRADYTFKAVPRDLPAGKAG
jgi:hypothetical protein